MASPVELMIDFQSVLENTLETGQHIEQNIADALTFISGAVADRIRQNLSGNVLNIRTGALFGSVKRTGPENDGSSLEATVTAGGPDAFYGVFFEHGGLGPYAIVHNSSKSLREFVQGGRLRFSAPRLHPAIPYKPWFQPAVDAVEPTIEPKLQEAINEALNDS